jgi:hypothetical protein
MSRTLAKGLRFILGYRFYSVFEFDLYDVYVLYGEKSLG